MAESFNGLGLRNCINVGLPVPAVPRDPRRLRRGRRGRGRLDHRRGPQRDQGHARCRATRCPQALQDIVVAGGVEAMLRSEGYLAAGQRAGDGRRAGQINESAAGEAGHDDVGDGAARRVDRRGRLRRRPRGRPSAGSRSGSSTPWACSSPGCRPRPVRSSAQWVRAQGANAREHRRRRPGTRRPPPSPPW